MGCNYFQGLEIALKLGQLLNYLRLRCLDAVTTRETSISEQKLLVFLDDYEVYTFSGWFGSNVTELIFLNRNWRMQSSATGEEGKFDWKLQAHNSTPLWFKYFSYSASQDTGLTPENLFTTISSLCGTSCKGSGIVCALEGHWSKLFTEWTFALWSLS